MLFFPYKQVIFLEDILVLSAFHFFENIFLFKYVLKWVLYWICDQITILGQLFDVWYVKKKNKKIKKIKNVFYEEKT